MRKGDGGVGVGNGTRLCRLRKFVVCPLPSLARWYWMEHLRLWAAGCQAIRPWWRSVVGSGFTAGLDFWMVDKELKKVKMGRLGIEN